MTRYINRTGINNPIGYVVKLDPSDPRGVLLALPADTDVLGVVIAIGLKTVSVAEVGIYKVLINNKFSNGDTVYLRKVNEKGGNGTCYASSSPTVPYVKIGTVLESGAGSVARVKLSISYVTTATAVGGTVNTIAKFTATDTVGNSGVTDDGTSVSTTENIKIASDSSKAYLGAGGDMTMWYDGTSGQIKTSDVAASDLVINCGTDKTIVLGEAVWDDSMVAPTAFRAGSTSLTFDALTATIYTHRWDVGDEVHVAVQFPHSLSVNTPIVPHLHIINKNSIGATAFNVAFDFYYTWANIGSVFPSELSELNVKQSFQSTGALTHKMLNFSALTPTAVQGGISSILLARIVRVAASVEAYNTAAIFTLGFDVHFQKDTLGSRQTSIK